MAGILAADARANGARRWDTPGTIAAIRKVQHLALPHVAMAVLRAAADRTLNTPAAIADLRSSAWRERLTEPIATEPEYCRTHQVQLKAGICPSCQGCDPCPERHCRVCGKAHVTVDARGTDQTCADCIRDTRTKLERIRATTALMTTAATERGIHSLAALHAGPTANVEAWGHVYASVKSGRLGRCATVRHQPCPATLDPAHGPLCDRNLCKHPSCTRIPGLCPDLIAWTLDCRDELHPLWVLGTWDFNVRDHLVPLVPTDEIGVDVVERTLTLDDAAGYLDQHLTRLAHDEDFAFDDLAREITTCANHLDEVLAIAPHTETGAPCPTCGRADLEKHYGDTDTDDRWTCPRCHAWWTETDYRNRVAALFVGVAPALTASQIRETYRVPEATVRSWALRGRVRKRGKDAAGRMLYDVADVLACRDTEAKTACALQRTVPPKCVDITGIA